MAASPDTPNERRLADGRVELVDTTRIEASPLYNYDLAPVPLARRTWTTYNYAALWISMAHCIPTYMLASGLLAAGMNWSQALITILLGNHDRAHSDSAEFPSGHEVRDSISRVRARGLWRAWIKCAGADACARRLWLVWDSGLDRRRSTPDDVHDVDS
jgi:hypothetical protein